jgi:hypothetical protein
MRPPGDERPKDDGEPTPIFDAVFSATRGQANKQKPSEEADKAGR